jgi:hypothetical protein
MRSIRLSWIVRRDRVGVEPRTRCLRFVNSQLESSDHRFYPLYGGNDLGGMFLTPEQVEEARKTLPEPTDWPYTPTLEHPDYCQHQ